MVIFGVEKKVLAQDGHYWSENYGNKSMLLSGTVNASVNDLGAVFYNPGRLGQIENPAFVISAKVYEWNTIKVEDGIAEGVDLKKSKFGGAPSLVAGTFTVPFLKNHKFAYSFLTRQRTQADFFIRVEKEGDIIEAIPGSEIFNGKLSYNTDFREEWIGLTWSPPLGKKLSFGLSSFISSINKSVSLDLDMKTLDENNQVASLSINRQYNYGTDGLIWKMGLAWDLNSIKLGMTVTTPKVKIRGKGSSLNEAYLIGVDTTGDGTNDDLYLFNIQEDLKSAFHSPWAIGLGVGFHFKKAIIHLSAEWYDKVALYNIIETAPFIVQSTGEELYFTLMDQLEAVINFGIGIELNLSEKSSFYTSFATNYSGVTSNIVRFAENKQEAYNSTLRADFLKFGSGFVLNTRWAEVTLGATYTGASQDFERPINFPDEGDDPIFDSNNTSTLKFTQWRIILGFSFPFAEKMKKSLEGEKEE
jgi:hypothetical protein